jgi:NTP pyrophosphatase (non-canonical NTP hydrolase)
MEITQLQQQVDEWIKTIGVRYFNELTNMAMLTEEVGEVARIIARRYGEQSEKESDKTKDLGENWQMYFCNIVPGQSDRSESSGCF